MARRTDDALEKIAGRAIFGATHAAKAKIVNQEKATPMTLIQTWFSYRGQLKPFDFFIKGFAPGILLGVVAMVLDDALNAHGKIFYFFLGFSVWPASAMILKLATSRSRTESEA